MLLCEIAIDGQHAGIVRIRDWSVSSLKVATRFQMLAGQRLQVRMPGSDRWIAARVAWRAGNLAGLTLFSIIAPERQTSSLGQLSSESGTCHRRDPAGRKHARR